LAILFNKYRIAGTNQKFNKQSYRNRSNTTVDIKLSTHERLHDNHLQARRSMPNYLKTKQFKNLREQKNKTGLNRMAKIG
jgi:hypothetical protein